MPETSMKISEALNKTLHQTMAVDDRIVCIGEDIAANGGVFRVTRGLLTAFGKARVIDTPISETAFVGMAIGAAMTGLRPVVEIMFCDFAGVCFDQIMNQAGKARFLANGRFSLPMVIRTTMGAGDGSGAMHSASLHGLFASIPGLTVVCPATAADAGGLLKSAIESDGPVIFMENKQLYEKSAFVSADLPPVSLGEARIACEGGDLTMVAAGAMVHRAQEAAGALATAGISVEVIDPRTIKPLDANAIAASVRKTGHLLVVDEGVPFAGFADAVIASVVERVFGDLKSAPRKLCPPDTPVPYAVAAEAFWQPDADDIVATAKSMMEM